MNARQMKALKQSNILKYRYLRFLGRKEKHLVNKISKGQEIYFDNAFWMKEKIIDASYNYKSQITFHKILVDHKLYSCYISALNGLNSLLYSTRTTGIVGYRKLKAIVKLIEKGNL